MTSLFTVAPEILGVQVIPSEEVRMVSLSPVVTQVLFVPRMNQEEFFTLLSLADAILDIPSFSGGNTSLEAFAMGAPIVTLPGKFLRGRVTAGLYRQMGVTDLIATDSENYLDLIIK